MKLIFIPPHPLTNFEMQKNYQNEPKFNRVCSRNNSPKRSEIVYSDSFGVEHVPEEIEEFIKNKNIIAHIFRLQSNNSIVCGYFCIGFVDFMVAGKPFS